MIKYEKLPIASRTFSLEDQNNFAKFSGDFNPIHLNEKESIKTHAGQPIVHGIHLLMWAINVLEVNITVNTSIHVNFKSQVDLNTEVFAHHDQQKNTILISNKDKLKIYADIKIIDHDNSNHIQPKNREVVFSLNSNSPEEPNIEDILLEDKNYNLFGGSKIGLGKIFFPFLVNNIGLNTVYEIACISSIVGMKIPGKHSLFVSLDLDFSSYENQENYIKVNSKHETLKIISINYHGINFKGDIKAFFRPEPSSTRSINDLKLEYKDRNLLSKKTVLVIGGSRGIGAYVTKLCAIMGGEVTFTFNTNEEDAQKISKEVTNDEKKIEYFKLDVTDLKSIYKINKSFDHIYYFATPKIISNESEDLDISLINKYHLFYVTSFEEVIKFFSLKNKKSNFLYPSTTYINENREGFKEYIASKIEGENLCKAFNRDLNIKILSPRLPPLDTDQNLSIIPKNHANASDYAFKIINLMMEKN